MWTEKVRKSEEKKRKETLLLGVVIVHLKDLPCICWRLSFWFPKILSATQHIGLIDFTKQTKGLGCICFVTLFFCSSQVFILSYFMFFNVGGILLHIGDRLIFIIMKFRSHMERQRTFNLWVKQRAKAKSMIQEMCPWEFKLGLDFPNLCFLSTWPIPWAEWKCKPKCFISTWLKGFEGPPTWMREHDIFYYEFDASSFWIAFIRNTQVSFFINALIRNILKLKNIQ